MNRASKALFFHICAQFAYVWLGFEYFVQERPPYLFLLGILWMITFDFFLDWLMPDSRRPGTKWVSVAIANSVYLSAEIYGQFSYPLFVAIPLANLIRRFARLNNRNVFNPSIAALFLSAILFPHDVFVPGRWQTNGPLAVAFYIVGGTVSYLSGSLAVSLSYLAGLSLSAIAFVGTGQFPSLQMPWQNYWQIMAGLVHAGTAIYAFHVISDPGTRPQKISHQIVFGLLIGMLEMSLRLRGFTPLMPVYLALALVYSMGQLTSASRSTQTSLSLFRP